MTTQAEHIPVLDRESFSKVKHVKALRVHKKQCNTVTKKLHDYVFRARLLRTVVADSAGDADYRLIRLKEGIGADLSGIPESVRALPEFKEIEVVDHDVTVKYDSLSAEDVLRKLLPEGCELPSSFETIGHIAHLNLRHALLPYKHLIGQVILDKNSPQIRTVINKVGKIHTVFRTFTMEAIAGPAEYEVELSESGVRFRFDFSTVYWNSRLQEEHKRFITAVAPSDVVCDMFAGVGPFALPLAKRGVRVLANDLNPNSYKYLVANAKLNKVTGVLSAYNLDARDFVRHLLRCNQQGALGTDETAAAAAAAAASGGAAAGVESKKAPAADEAAGDGEDGDGEDGDGEDGDGEDGDGDGEQQQQPALESGTLACTPFTRVVMNLPADSIQFLDVFRHNFVRGLWTAPLPTIHCYCFSAEEDPVADVIARVSAVLGGVEFPAAAIKVRRVRDVAPRKLMMVAIFQLPEEAAFPPPTTGSSSVASSSASCSASEATSGAAAAAPPPPRSSCSASNQNKRKPEELPAAAPPQKK